MSLRMRSAYSVLKRAISNFELCYQVRKRGSVVLSMCCTSLHGALYCPIKVDLYQLLEALFYSTTGAYNCPIKVDLYHIPPEFYQVCHIKDYEEIGPASVAMTLCLESGPQTGGDNRVRCPGPWPREGPIGSTVATSIV